MNTTTITPVDFTAKMGFQAIRNNLEGLGMFDPGLFDYDALAGEASGKIVIKALSKNNGIETYTLWGELKDNPGFVAASKILMQKGAWVWMEKVQDSTMPPKQYDLSPAGAKHYNGNECPVAIKRFRHDRQHRSVNIKLCEYTTVTCEETGISELVRLPIPSALNESLNLPTQNPLAFPENVRTLLRHYNKSGIRIEQELQPQVLAGVLLTVLRSKGLLICHDAPKANAFLRCAKPETLGHAIRYFWYSSSGVGMPGLSVNLEDQKRVSSVLAGVDMSEDERREQLADYFILNYLRACRGESTANDPSHIVFTPSRKNQTKTVRVYTDPVQAQAKKAQLDAGLGKNLVTALRSQFPGQHTLLLQNVENTLKILAMASQKLRYDIAAKLRSVFPENENAAKLASIFQSVKSDAIEDDLFSFSQSLKTEIKEFQDSPKGTVRQTVKFDFMSKLQPKDVKKDIE